MGLTLNYELRLPATLTSDEVNHRLEALRNQALNLPFGDVSPLIESPGSELENRLESFLAVWAGVIARPVDEEIPPRVGDVTTVRGFVVYPGRGCEGAAFGFLRRATRDGGAPEWFWQGCCKTQYAFMVNSEHFVACHATLVALLDHAIELGFEVNVDDEGHYWETRDPTRLLAEVDYMNRLVARVAGRFNDSMPPGSVDAPIFEHPEFERLEMGANRRPQ